MTINERFGNYIKRTLKDMQLKTVLKSHLASTFYRETKIIYIAINGFEIITKGY